MPFSWPRPAPAEDVSPSLEVVIEPGEAFEYRARVESSLGDGAVRHTIRSPPSEDRPEALYRWAGSGRGTQRIWDAETEPREQMRQLGEELFRAVFRDDAAARLYSALAASRQLGRALPIRFRLCGDPRLADWPWEALWDPQSRSFLGLDQATISRIVERSPRLSRSGGRAGLNVLAVAAAPRGRDEIDVTGELAGIDAAVAGGAVRGRVHLSVLRGATRHSLRERLRGAQLEVLHFIGHGEPAAILLEGEDARPDPVSAEELVAMFGWRPRRGRRRCAGLPRLVVLNACDGARAPGSGLLDGLAQQLVTLGVPAVIAMAFPITDRTALRFSQELYGRLAAGDPLEEALTETRNALFALGHGPGWLAPVLYLHPSRSRLGAEALPVLGRRWPTWVAGLGLAALAAVSGLVPWARPSLETATLSVPVLPASDPACPSPPGIELHFVKLEPGTFLMGSAKERDEGPMHLVTLTKPFCLMATEVTEEQWAKVMGRPTGPSLLPRASISFEDAQDFLRHLNERVGHLAFRLPTEAEWEYAARAGVNSAYSFGDDSAQLRLHGNCRSASVTDGFEGLAPVATFHPNAWGLHDMHGNAWEWVSDWYERYPSGPVVDPLGPPMGTRRVRRGGAHDSSAVSCRASSRATSSPDSSWGNYGLRLAQDAGLVQRVR